MSMQRDKFIDYDELMRCIVTTLGPNVSDVALMIVRETLPGLC